MASFPAPTTLLVKPLGAAAAMHRHDWIGWDHDLRLIGAAAVVAVLTALTVMTILERIRTHGRHRWPWTAALGFVSGTGIWSTHFLAMLADNPGMSVHYDVVRTAGSALIAMVITAAAWSAAIRTSPWSRTAAGLLLVTGIATMHFVGMSAMRVPGLLSWDGPRLAVAAGGALLCAHWCISELHRRGPANWRPPAGFVLAIVTLHFGAMAAMRMTMGPADPVHGGQLDERSLAMIVLFGALAVVAAGFCIALIDRLSERDALNARIAELAYHDPLTGLPNRRAAERRLEEMLVRADAAGDPVAILAIDLDRFKPVNDLYGHAVGDALLAEVGARLRACLRPDDLVARVGGDEFLAVISPDPATHLLSAGDTGARVVEAMTRPFVIDGHTIGIGASVGYACFPDEGREIGLLLRRADLALYEAKAGGRGTARLYDHELDGSHLRRERLAADLPRAIAEGALRLTYQPVIACQRGTLIGFEALLRWPHPELGMIGPDELLPLVEVHRAWPAVGRWVLHQACSAAALWPHRGFVAVNIAPSQLAEEGLSALVAAILVDTGLAPDRLELEIRERRLVDPKDGANAELARLRALGVRLAIDGFGGGSGTLLDLVKAPVDRLKIDERLVQGLDEPPYPDLVRTIIDLGKRLGIAVTAKGVETRSQHAALRALGCPAAQGHYYPAMFPRDVAMTLAPDAAADDQFAA